MRTHAALLVSALVAVAVLYAALWSCASLGVEPVAYVPSGQYHPAIILSLRGIGIWVAIAIAWSFLALVVVSRARRARLFLAGSTLSIASILYVSVLHPHFLYTLLPKLWSKIWTSQLGVFVTSFAPLRALHDGGSPARFLPWIGVHALLLWGFFEWMRAHDSARSTGEVRGA